MQANELFTQPNTILLDGGMGTMLQAAGLKLGARPEELNITDPQLIESIHSRYAAAGSRIINANTFGASAHKLAGSEYTLEEIIAAGIANCKRACAPYGALAALDVGPLGELLEPNGTLAFEDAVAEYGRIVRAGVAAGADLVFFETFTDLYELKAALLAAKENCDLPILASMSFEAGGRTFTGCTVESFAVTARGLGANAVGINCSLGPKEIFPMAKRLAEALPGDFPVFVKPNAGLPRADGSGYDITPQLFAMEMKPYRDLKLFAAGGCCGTTPDFIKLLNGVFADCKPGRPAHAMPSVLCSPMDFVTVDGITVVGERINPTGKKRFQQALREGDMNYILEQAVSQSEAGAQVLDVNVGAPGVDEPAVMEQVVKALQSVVSLPLQLDSSHADALERGLRVYNGKPIVNSVNGETEVLERVLPLCKKYGAAVVGLAIDERGIQPSADARFEIAKRVVDAALAHGIPREDIYIDCLTLTATGDLTQSEGWRQGMFYPQDPAARLAVLAAGLTPGCKVLDACAAPGGKSFAAAMVMGDRGEIHACDLHPHKKALIQAGADRLGLQSITPQVADGKKPRKGWGEAFDVVLADVPCSGLGVLRKKPEIRYKAPEALEGLPQIQGEILANVSTYVRPGGVLLYSTCTLRTQENEAVVQAFLASHPDFHLEAFRLPGPLGLVEAGQCTLWPQRLETDGFFLAKLRKEGAHA